MSENGYTKLGLQDAIDNAKGKLSHGDLDRVRYWVRDRGMSPVDAVAHVLKKREEEQANGTRERQRAVWGMKPPRNLAPGEFERTLKRQRAAKRGSSREAAAAYPRPTR